MDCSIDHSRNRYPFCIVWTPIPLLTWVFPIIGHMGIALSSGVIRDFAGPYYVSEDNMAFGRPTKYWLLQPSLARGAISGWDAAVMESSEIYGGRMHNLICDNCHSHVATALNMMKYDGSSNWNMVKLAFSMILYGKFVSFTSFVKTWLPFSILVLIIILCVYFLYRKTYSTTSGGAVKQALDHVLQAAILILKQDVFQE